MFNKTLDLLQFNFRFFVNNLPLLKKYIQPGERLLEAGCGEGAIVFGLDIKNLDVVGIDHDKRKIDYANEKNSNSRVELLNCDLLEYLDGKNYFDVIMFSDVLSNINLEKQKEILKRSVKSLNPGGRIVIKAVNRDHFLFSFTKLFSSFIYFVLRRSKSDSSEFYYQTHDQFEIELRGLNLRVEKKLFNRLIFPYFLIVGFSEN